jgi:hypothetical protein
VANWFDENAPDQQGDWFSRNAPTPSALPTPEGGGDISSIMERPVRALAKYAKGMVQFPTERPTIGQAATAALRGGDITTQALNRIQQIQEAEKTPAWSQERFDAGIGTTLDLLGLGAMLKAGTLPQLRARAPVEPPAVQPGPAGFTLAHSEPPVPLPEVPIQQPFQPVEPSQPIPYGPAAQPYQQPPPPTGQIAATDLWPLSSQGIPPEDIPYAGVQPPAQEPPPVAPPAPPVEPAPAVAPAPQPAPVVEQPKLPIETPKQFKVRPPFDAFGSELTPVAQHIVNDLGGVISKSAAKSRGRYEGNTALWDGAPALSHATHNKVYNPNGVMPDIAAQSLYNAGLIEDPYVDTMWQHIEAESRAARQIAKETQRQSAVEKAVTKQDKAFFRVQNLPNVGVPEVAGRDLQIGDTVKVAGETFKVTDIDPDTFDVTLEDGTRFGVQHVADNEVIYGEHERPEPLKLVPPESDAEQLAAAAAEREANAQLNAEADKKAQVQYGWQQKLTGTAGDLGQAELGGEVGGDEGLFGRGGIERAGEGGGIPLPFRGRVMAQGAVRGSGRYKPVYQINKEAGDLVNKLAASRESGALKAEYRWRQVVGDLTKEQQDVLGQYLVSERLKTVNPDHPQILSPLDTAKIERNPDIARALNRYKREVKPEIESLRKKAGLTATAAEGKGREFVSLIPATDEMLPEVQTPVGGVPLRFRSKTTRFAQHAEGNALKYYTNLRNILEESYGEVTQKANFRELYDFLARKGLARQEPVGEIQGQPAQVTVVGRAAKGENSASLPEVAFMPTQISAAIRDIMEQPPKITSPVGEAIKFAQRGVTGAALTANPAEIVNHMRRQLDSVSAEPPAHVPLPIRAVEGLMPYFGPRLGTAIRAITQDMSLPENQSILQDIFDAGGGSTRAFQEYQAKRIPGVKQLQHASQKLLFGIPKGRGVGGWDLRMRVQLEKIRRAVEGDTDPERIRKFSNQIGQYTSKPDKFIEIWRKFQPYAATTGPLRVTEFRQLFGGSGLKAKTAAGALGLRAETLLRGAGGTAIALATANHLLSGKWPWENDRGHEMDLNTGIRDEKGKTVYVNLTKLAPTVSRPIKSLSVPELLRERGATEGRSLLAAGLVGPANTLLSGISGPLSNAALTGASGYAPYLTKEPGRPPTFYDLASTHGEPQSGLMADRGVRQLAAALFGVNPVGRSFGESQLPSPLKYIERPVPGIEPFGKIFTTSYEKPGATGVNVEEVLKRMMRYRQRIQRLGR